MIDEVYLLKAREFDDTEFLEDYKIYLFSEREDVISFVAHFTRLHTDVEIDIERKEIL